jgi:RHS repeat-associated protein
MSRLGSKTSWVTAIVCAAVVGQVLVGVSSAVAAGELPTGPDGGPSNFVPTSKPRTSNDIPDLPDSTPLPDKLSDLPDGSTSLDPAKAWSTAGDIPVEVRDSTKVTVPGDAPGDPAVTEPIPDSEAVSSAPPVQVSVTPADETSSPSLLLNVTPTGAQTGATGTPSPDPSSSTSPSPSPSTDTPSASADPTGAARLRARAADPTDVPMPTTDPTPSDTPSQTPGTGATTPSDPGTTSADGTTTAVQVKLSYADFRYVYAGDWGARLQVMAYPACFTVTPTAPECDQGVRVPSVNDTGTQTLTFTTGDLDSPLLTPDVPADTGSTAVPESSQVSPRRSGAKAVSYVRTSSLAPAATTSSGTVYVASASADGGSGNYAAEPLIPSADWQVGQGSGDFSYSYPFNLPPPAVAGPTPSLGLSYSSGSEDGLTIAANGQASQAGIGWSMDPGYIERTFKPCAEDGWPNKGDLCWMWDAAHNTTLQDLSIVFNGRSSRLIRIGVGNSYRLQDDPGWTVTRVLGTDGGTSGGVAVPDNQDDDNESFKVQSPDGTTYWFGWGNGTQSVSTVPVYGNDANELCSAKTDNEGHYCEHKAWRWNLDRVVDSHNNLVVYNYNQETNYYSRYGLQANRQIYDRGSYLTDIEYGFGATDNYTKVVVNSAPRCVDALADANTPCPGTARAYPNEWPDVPGNLICYDQATDDTCLNGSPTFFSTRRYDAVNTSRYFTDSSGSHSVLVDSYALNQGYPVPDGATGPDSGIKDLWLKSVVHTGKSGTAITLPGVYFTGEFRHNRVVTPSGGYSFQKNRIVGIRTETGAKIDVTYGHEVNRDCTQAYVTGLQRFASTRECFPAQYTNSVGDDNWEWWHKYVVKSIVLSDPTIGVSNGGSTATTDGALGELQEYDYTYVDAPAWRFRNDPSVKDTHETWNDWRGYHTVLIDTRKVGTDQVPDSAVLSREQITTYQGMDATRKNNTTDPATGNYYINDSHVSTSDGVAHLDSTWYAGRVLEDIVQTPAGSGFTVASQQRNDWAQIPTADYAFGPDARFVYESKSRSIPHSGAAEEDTTNTVDPGNPYSVGSATYYQGPLLGALEQVVDDRATSSTSDDVATCTDYVAANTSGSVLRLAYRVTVRSTSCAGPTVLKKSESYYDSNSTLTAAPSAGDLTQSVSYVDNANNTIRVESNYDADGRIRESTVPYAFAGTGFDTSRTTDHPVTVTTYNASTNASNMLTTVSTTTPSGPGLTAMTSSVQYDTARSLPVKITDANQQVTTVTRDALGRPVTVDEPGVPIGFHSIQYAYSIPANSPAHIATTTLRDVGQSDVSYDYYDGWGRQIEHQVPNQAGDGRVVSLTGYDERGLTRLSVPAIAVSGTAADWAYPADQREIPHFQLTDYDALQKPLNVTDESGNGLGRAIDVNSVSTTSYGATSTDVSVAATAGGTALNKTHTDFYPAGQVKRVTQYLNGHDAGTGDDTAKYFYTPTGDLQYILTPTTGSPTDTDPSDPTAVDTSQWARYQYSYDWLGRRTDAIDPDAGETTYAYDALGDTTRVAQPAFEATKGHVETTYDLLGRPTKRENVTSGGRSPIADWAYDSATNGVGRPASTVSHTSFGDFTTSVSGYDARGNPQASTVTYPAALTGEAASGTTSKTTSYTYNELGEVKTATLPAVPGLTATTVTNGYGPNGLMLSMQTPERYIAAVTYDSTNRPSTLATGITTTDPNLINRVYTWSSQDRLTSVYNQVGNYYGPAVAMAYSYAYDTVGNPLRVTGMRQDAAGGSYSTGAWCYQYDGINRLTSAVTGTPDSQTGCTAGSSAPTTVTGANFSLSYSYKQTRLSRVSNGDASRQVDYSYGPTNRPHAATGLTLGGSSGSTTGLPTAGSLSYDAAGQAMSWTPAGSSSSATFNSDVQGNLQSTNVGATVTGSFAYGADGTRLVRKVGNATVLYLGDTEITATTSGTTTTATSRRFYSTPGGRPLAVETQDGTDADAVNDWTYTAGDNQNTVRYSRDAQTGVFKHDTYYPSGSPIVSTSQLPGERGFVDKTHDPDGTIRLDHRVYAPLLNVLTTPDPLMDSMDPQNLNAYAYSRNNPVGLGDPSGLGPHCPTDQCPTATVCTKVQNCGVDGKGGSNGWSQDPPPYNGPVTSIPACTRACPQGATGTSAEGWRDIRNFGAGLVSELSHLAADSTAGGIYCMAIDLACPSHWIDKGLTSQGANLNSGAAKGGALAANIPILLVPGLGEADAVEVTLTSAAETAETAAVNGETAATAYGRLMHQTFDYGPGFEREFTLRAGGRVDAINFDTREVLELKPNNPRAIRLGERQLEGYIAKLNAQFPGDPWIGRVVTYDRP